MIPYKQRKALLESLMKSVDWEIGNGYLYKKDVYALLSQAFRLAEVHTQSRLTAGHGPHEAETGKFDSSDCDTNHGEKQ